MVHFYFSDVVFVDSFSDLYDVYRSVRTFGKSSPKGGQKPGEGQKRKIQKPA
jgi:hypothetical protein